MNQRIQKIQFELEPYRRQLLDHPVYAKIDSLAAVHGLMEFHVFAVWDFMSLLKSLQQQLTSTQVPWVPPQNRLGSRLVNEIVLAEESDEDGKGGFASHFDLYLSAMHQSGADSATIEQFIQRLRAGDTVQQALVGAQANEAVTAFVTQTFQVIDSGDLPAIASAFTFGREDLLPDVFRKIVARIEQDSGQSLGEFRYYLDRHIDLDEDEHGPMAYELIALLCGDDDQAWQRATTAAIAALESRLRLWNALDNHLQNLNTQELQESIEHPAR